MKKRILVALVAGLTVFASTFAFAATLGGLTTDGVGAGSSAVAGCDTDGVTTSYSAAAWDVTDKRYEVGQVVVGGVADTCDGDTVKVALTDSGGAQLGEGTLVIPTDGSTSHPVNLTTGVAAADILGIHVVIGG